jgi:hypothetical protein
MPVEFRKPDQKEEDCMRRIAYLIVVAVCFGALGQSSLAAQDYGDNPNPVLFPKQSDPYGADISTWGERLTQWIYAQPLAHNPLFDQTGADCAVAQKGPVWFIPPIAGPRVFSGSRTCAIPHGKAILLDIGHDTEDYPCPAFPGFQPGPGQSLYDFLSATAKTVMDSVNLLDVSLDGQRFSDVLGYRFSSDDLFTITGDTSLQVFDPCITGSPQSAVVDGFFMLFKPLHRGPHTIWVHGTNTFGADKTFTFHLNVE